jgi:phenylacetate-CoA ligase
MVAYAYRYVPYYRETLDRLGLTPDDFRTAADLARLPLLETEAYRRDPERFLSTAQPAERYLRLFTSGSSGVPRVIYHDARACLDNIAHAERERAIISDLLGHPAHYRETALHMTHNESTAHLIQRFTRQAAWLPRAVGIERQNLSIFDSLEDQVRQIDQFQPEVLTSVGGHLTALFSYLGKRGQPCHLPRAVAYASEGATESTRRLIMEGFGIPVFNTYQAVEALKIGFECEQHRGFHLNVDLYPLRVIDAEGRTVAPGEVGTTVISNLVNHATVLLNYHLADFTTLDPAPCPCGRTLPLTSFLQGRASDCLQLGGRTLRPGTIEQIFSAQEDAWQYQVIQEGPSRVRVLVVAAPDADPEAVSAGVLAGFRAACGEAVSVDLHFVDAIPRPAVGKLRPLLALDREASA